MSQPPTRSKLAIKGSSKIVSDFFEFSIHSILYQRGIYPPEDFKVVKKYGLNLLVSIDDEVINYVRRIMKQLHRWIYSGKISKLVLAITNKDTFETVEKWQFDIESTSLPKTQQSEVNSPSDGSQQSNQEVEPKSKDQIQREIQAIIRQITASITFLPELKKSESDEFTFNVLVYAKPNCKVPEDWADADAKEIEGGSVESVKFKSFQTDVHQVGTLVSYKIEE
ncbi:unnamed protein product [Ambrosiozyma monospora]|uniref:Unnamed protein product n=1 Tax=Ambrosiozyma monospora TaxID=43982 RepID=A0A9W6Z1H5_AMBMO|nr:unnamed protein product [Ambrosiozyma monospora]